MHSTPTAAKAQPAKPAWAAVCGSATVRTNSSTLAPRQDINIYFQPLSSIAGK